jgi:predicted metal-dependent hydrolase
MTPDSHHVQYGNETIEYVIVRRERATLEIAVEPDSSVVVAAPMAASLEAIADRVRRRGAWVRRQQRFFFQYIPLTPQRRFVGGETHLYLGRHYRLRVVPATTAGVKLIRGFLVVESCEHNRPEATRDILYSWYRERAHVKFADRLEANLLRFADPEAFRPSEIVVRQLRQRWGSMSPARRLLLNRRLIEAPIDGIDYVITHELCHIAQPHHNSAFFELLDRILPDWKRRKERLERAMS